MWRGHVQYLWRDVVQQLQRRLRVSCRVDERDAGGGDVPTSGRPIYVPVGHP
jgi:hypothetical protein